MLNAFEISSESGLVRISFSFVLISLFRFTLYLFCARTSKM